MKPRRWKNQKGKLLHGDSSSTSPKSSGSQYSKGSEYLLSRSLVLASTNNCPSGNSKALVHYTCSGCKKPIKKDKYLLKTCNNYWHEDCLRCDRCHDRLAELGSTLYTKSSMNLCRKDYLELFGETGVCSVCEKLIRATEMVMRAKQNVYHLECFACQMCNERFCVGDRFYLCENKVVCQYDFEEHILPIQKSIIAQNEASDCYSRQNASMNFIRDQQFDIMNMQQEVEHLNNIQCHEANDLCDRNILDESCDGEAEQDTGRQQSFHNLITIQHRDNNLTRYIQLDDLRTAKRLGEEAGSSSKAISKKDDAHNKQSKSKEGLSKGSLNNDVESLFCNHNNESFIKNGTGDDDNTLVAIKGHKNDEAARS